MLKYNVKLYASCFIYDVCKAKFYYFFNIIKYEKTTISETYNKLCNKIEVYCMVNTAFEPTPNSKPTCEMLLLHKNMLKMGK